MPAISDEVLLESAVLVYLACAKLTDGDLDPREVEAIGTQVRSLVPRLSPVYSDQIIRDVAEHFGAFEAPDLLLGEVVRSAERLAEDLERDELEGLVRGLIRISEADGSVSVQERDFVSAVARTFGVTLDSGDDS
jgi:tellurite resistance protein